MTTTQHMLTQAFKAMLGPERTHADEIAPERTHADEIAMGLEFGCSVTRGIAQDLLNTLSILLSFPVDCAYKQSVNRYSQHLHQARPHILGAIAWLEAVTDFDGEMCREELAEGWTKDPGDRAHCIATIVLEHIAGYWGGVIEQLEEHYGDSPLSAVIYRAKRIDRHYRDGVAA